MKKTFIFLVGGMLMLAACEQPNTGANETTSETPAKPKLSFAYVNSDSLAANYLYFSEINDQLETKRAKYEKEFANRANGLQRQIQDFQQTANNMTIAQARAVEEDLTRKQQNLQQYQQSLTQELLKEEAKLNKELYEKVATYLADYGKSKGIDFIFKYSTAGEIWYGDSSYDITEEIIKGLNEQYKAGQKVTPADSTTVN